MSGEAYEKASNNANNKTSEKVRIGPASKAVSVYTNPGISENIVSSSAYDNCNTYFYGKEKGVEMRK